jgi:NADH-quinone oxidoreductase subunit M
MNNLPAPFLTAGLSCLLSTSLIGLRCPKARSFRYPAALGTGLALLAFAFAAASALMHPHSPANDPLLPWLRVDPLNAIPLVFYTLLLLVFLLIAPTRDCSGTAPAGLLLITVGTLGSYCAATLPVLAAGWWITALPFALGLFGTSPTRWLNTAFLGASAAALTAFVWLTHTSSIDAAPKLNALVLTLLLLAVALRKGLFPLHSWVVASFEHGPLLPSILLFNGHLGALLTARTEAARLHEVMEPALEWLSIAALITALLTSVRGFAETKPRRLLAFVCVSQAAFILAGLATSNRQGITGALLHWFVVAVASSTLAGIIRILEVRVMDAANPEGHLGLAVRTPRLATFFLVSALALVGLPGTLGYNAEDLLFHGALQTHPRLGLCLLAATAFNAITLLRLYSVLFLGVPEKNVIHVPDALPRERWPTAACLCLLVAGGLLASKLFPALAGVTDTLHPIPETHPPHTASKAMNR